MWDDDKQQQLNDLQRRAEQGTLADDEQQRLDYLLHHLEQAEWTALRPTLGRLCDEQDYLLADLSQLQARNAVLTALATRYTDLLTRAKTQLAGLAQEREALRAEYERTLQDVARP